MNSPPTFLWKLLPKKLKFNDVCVLFKHSNFALECWKCTLTGPDFKIFPRKHAPGTPKVTPAFSTCNSRLWHKFFLLHLLQRFCHLLKTSLKTLSLRVVFRSPQQSKGQRHFSLYDCFNSLNIFQDDLDNHNDPGPSCSNIG